MSTDTHDSTVVMAATVNADIRTLTTAVCMSTAENLVDIVSELVGQNNSVSIAPEVPVTITDKEKSVPVLAFVAFSGTNLYGTQLVVLQCSDESYEEIANLLGYSMPKEQVNYLYLLAKRTASTIEVAQAVAWTHDDGLWSALAHLLNVNEPQ